MRFFVRTFGALFIIVFAIGVLSVSGVRLKVALEEKTENSFKSRYSKERVYSAYVDRLESVVVKPKIYAYGEAKSWRSLELRATNSGQLIFLSENFREGGRVLKGELLFKIDPQESLDNFAVAEVNLLEARAEYDEARIAQELLNFDKRDSEEQLKLRSRALSRQKSLNNSGITTKSAVENAEILYSNANQTLSARKNAVAKGEARIARAKIAVTRANISLEQAKRRVSDNEYRAPFDGVIASVLVAPGRLLNKNEQLGVLIDPSSIEAAFQVSNSEFIRMVDEKGNLLPLPIKAKKKEEKDALVFSGVIQRSGAEVIAGTSGRQIFASLSGDKSSLIKAGDFLIVEIEENSLSEVAVIPADAIDPERTILLLTDDDRLEEYKVNILRRQNNEVIINNVPFGRHYVTKLSPQLDAGLKVNPLGLDCRNTESSNCNENTERDSKVSLSDEDRSELVAIVNNNKRLPAEVKQNILKKLNAEKVPIKLINRLKN